MRVLLVAPEICAPWTEGRKKFVRDLAVELGQRDEVFVMTTRVGNEPPVLGVPCEANKVDWKPLHLSSILGRLAGRIQTFRPDIVLNFPYGTFRSYYGPVNRFYMRRVDDSCRVRNTPCLTVMYSIDDSTTPMELSRTVRVLAAGKRESWDGRVVEPGVSDKDWPEKLERRSNGRTLLFMAGMWERSLKRLQHVLDVRGLDVLLRAGASLSRAEVKLILASPLFSEPGLVDAVRGNAANTWTREALEFESTVEVPQIYARTDLFVFPYSASISRFVPTSVLEAMLSGTPVVISDLPLFAELTNGGGTAYTFKADSPESLAGAVIRALEDPKGRERISGKARVLVRERWSIEHSADQVRAIAEEILAG